ncbi:MAG: helix-turn-helix domain-containing protein [Dehalococcoidia bacterium]|nr:helix-turn-helix domain-containing protein [Dehalococcoidia bacterium]
MPEKDHTGNLALGRRIRLAREDAGFPTQPELVARLNMLAPDGLGPYTRSWLANIEAGLRGIRVHDLVVVARVLRVSSGDLLDGADGAPGALARAVRPFEGKITPRQQRLLAQLLREWAESNEGVADDKAATGAG